jgi:hypothetical protein
MKTTIYFNEKLHKYTDNLGNPYTSVTTVIGKYHKKFDDDAIKIAIACEHIGRNPNHPKYFKYKGLSKDAILLKWFNLGEEGRNNGTAKHDFLETAIKVSTGYNIIESSLIDGTIYTLEDIREHPNLGELTINWFINTGIREKYPIIFNDLVTLANAGFRFYAEIGVFNIELLISGLIDLFAIKDDLLVIIDWKTNKADIRFESGYYEKDNNNNLTDNFIYKHDYMFQPIEHLADSVGNHYSLQTSGYGWMAEQFGYKLISILLYQIRENNDRTERVDKLVMPILKNEAKIMFEHHFKSLIKKTQLNIFN